jgi:hypothetical protein
VTPASDRAYRIYGLMLRTNRPLPQLVAGDPAAGGDAVDVWFGTGAGPTATPRVRYGDDRAALEFVVEPEGRRVWADWHGPDVHPSVARATVLLAGPVLGSVLRLRGTTSLHGCAVAVGGAAIVLLGERRAGKSSLAAALAQRGHRVLADDVAAIVEEPAGWTVQPGYPRLRLAEATIAALRDGGPVPPDGDKRYVELSCAAGARAWRFASEPLPLRSIYVLERGAALAAPQLSELGGAHQLALLVRHLRTAVLPLPPAVRADELARLARLATATSVRRLTCPEGLDGLGDTCRLLAGAPDRVA